MSKLLIFCFNSIAMFFFVFSQENIKLPRIVVSTTPFGVFVNTIPLGFEYTPSPFIALNIKGSYTYSKTGKNDLNYFKLHGSSIGGDVKFFMQHKIGGQRFFTLFKGTRKYEKELSTIGKPSGSLIVTKSYLKIDYRYEDLRNQTFFRGEPIDGFDFVHVGGLAFGVEWFFNNMIYANFYIGPYYYYRNASDHYLNNLQKASFFQSMLLKGSTGTKINLGFDLGFHF